MLSAYAALLAAFREGKAVDIIRISNLKKYYGKHVGIENFSFSVKEGLVDLINGDRPAVKLVQVDVVCLQAPQGRFARLHDIFC